MIGSCQLFCFSVFKKKCQDRLRVWRTRYKRKEVILKVALENSLFFFFSFLLWLFFCLFVCCFLSLPAAWGSSRSRDQNLCPSNDKAGSLTARPPGNTQEDLCIDSESMRTSITLKSALAAGPLSCWPLLWSWTPWVVLPRGHPWASPIFRFAVASV